MTHSDDLPDYTSVASETLLKECKAFPERSILSSFALANHLKPRERQLLRMICLGMKNSDIGPLMKVSDATVRFHMTNLHRKTETTSKAGLVLQVWKWSLQVQAEQPAKVAI